MYELEDLNVKTFLTVMYQLDDLTVKPVFLNDDISTGGFNCEAGVS